MPRKVNLSSKESLFSDRGETRDEISIAAEREVDRKIIVAALIVEFLYLTEYLSKIDVNIRFFREKAIKRREVVFNLLDLLAANILVINELGELDDAKAALLDIISYSKILTAKVESEAKDIERLEDFEHVKKRASELFRSPLTEIDIDSVKRAINILLDYYSECPKSLTKFRPLGDSLEIARIEVVRDCQKCLYREGVGMTQLVPAAITLIGNFVWLLHDNGRVPKMPEKPRDVLGHIKRNVNPSCRCTL